MPIYVTPVKVDLVKGAEASQNLYETTQTRIFQVWGMSSFNADIRPTVALNVSGIPLLGDPIPEAAYAGMICVNKKTEVCDNPDVINVIVFYRWRNYLGSYLKSVGGSLQVIHKVAMELGTGTASKMMVPALLTYSTGTTSSDTTVSVPAVYNAEIINELITFKFLEQIDPEYFNSTYPGYTNSKVWRGYPCRTLKILPMQGTTQDNFWFDNQYTFQYKVDSWDQYLLYYDAFGNTPPAVLQDINYSIPLTPGTGTIAKGNGWRRMALEPQVDFNLIFNNLPTAPPNTYGLDLNSFLGS